MGTIHGRPSVGLDRRRFNGHINMGNGAVKGCRLKLHGPSRTIVFSVYQRFGVDRR